jgi:hypothetical protein
MHRNDDLTLAPPFMLVSVKTTAMLGQPFPKCGTFHCFIPMHQDLHCVEQRWSRFPEQNGGLAMYGTGHYSFVTSEKSFVMSEMGAV